MTFRGTRLVYGPLLAAALVAPLGTGCDQVTKASEAACGPCGVVAEGDVGISGSAKLDGFFKAVADMNQAVVKVNGNFEADLSALEAAFGVTAAAGATLDARVDGVIAAVQAEITANVQGGLVVNYVAPSCSADVNVAVDAQAKCEVKGGCEAQVDPGSVKVECSGTCTGACEGGCEGTAQCKVEAPSVACSGTCEGTCQLDAAATCNGTCNGTCSGTCSAYDGQGNCAGKCDGNCTGNCQLAAAASCSGTCSGSCTADQGTAECTGEVKCSGTCSGSCSGGCEGEATPPSASASCDVSADCQAQAKAQASANVECTPPQLDIGFEFAAGVDASAQAAFTAKIAALKLHGVAMLQGFTKYQALITGKVNGEAVFATPPIEVVIGELQGVIDAGVKGKLVAEIPKGRIACVIPAMTASVTMLGDMTSEATANLAAQAKFATAMTGGFSG